MASNANRRRTVVLGKGALGIRVAEWFRRSDDYDLVWVVPAVPEPTWTESMIAWCRVHEVPYVGTGHYKDIPGVRGEGWSVDLAFSCFYDRVIREWFIDKTARILNLHNGPLPKYRGIAPINWALKNDERMHGTTIHEITPRIDDGPIVGQVLYSIYPEFDEVVDVYRRSLDYAYLLFEKTMPLLDRITPQPQDETRATYYSRRDAERLGDRRGFTRAQSV